MTRTSAVTGVSVSRPALIARYDKPGRFYLLATLIPWVLWLVAGYLSHRDEPASAPIAVLGLAGLLAPIAVAWALIRRDPVLVRDTLHRLVNVREVRPVFVLLAVFLLPAALLLATACSVALGYSPDVDRLRRDLGAVAPAVGDDPGLLPGGGCRDGRAGDDQLPGLGVSIRHPDELDLLPKWPQHPGRHRVPPRGQCGKRDLPDPP